MVQPCQRPSTSFRLLFFFGKNRSTIENDEIVRHCLDLMRNRAVQSDLHGVGHLAALCSNTFMNGGTGI
jgi:hypothetical protein